MLDATDKKAKTKKHRGYKGTKKLKRCDHFEKLSSSSAGCDDDNNDCDWYDDD